MARFESTEYTRAANGEWYLVTWEWNNGWNLIHCRRATAEEVADWLTNPVAKTGQK